MNQEILGKISKKYKLTFLRMFGSYVVNPKKARDVDLAYGPGPLSAKETLSLIRELEDYFKSTVDLIPLTLDCPSLLAREIAKKSKAIYEKKNQGQRDYVLLMDALLAKADEESIYKPNAIRRIEFQRTMKALKND